MKLLITGTRGTIGPRLLAAAHQRGWETVAWDRSQADPLDEAAVQAFLDRQAVQGLIHLATGPEAWAAQLARFAGERGVPLVHVSSAMVFHHQPDGPHGLHDERNAQDDYGRYKIRCEDAVLQAAGHASLVRIGWQIDDSASGNHMLAALEGWQQQQGRVSASPHWRPACSWLADTAQALLGLVSRPIAGLVHVDSNAEEGHDFVAIARALQQRFARGHWRVQADGDYVHDQRLVGGQALVPPLSARLPLASNG